MEINLLSSKIRDLAKSIGIDTLGFAKASAFSTMTFDNPQQADPGLSLPEAKSIIVAGVYIGGLTLPVWDNPWYGRTSRLYLSGFFLDVVKQLEPVANYLRNEGYQALVCDGSADRGSILPLKLAAIRSGLGWQGKHSLLISRKYGSFLALGGIITNAALEHNTEEVRNYCRNCDKCQTACPVAALDQPYVLDREKCLSNLLQVDPLPESAQAVLENRVGDCEICQYACPWNKKHFDQPLQTNMTMAFQKEIKTWEDIFYLPKLVNMSEIEYIEKLGHLNTGIPYRLFQRNVLKALEKARALSSL